MSNIQPSATVAINSLAAEKKARGEKVHNFAAGDPILPSHPAVIEAVTSALERAQPILYPPVAGIPELRQVAAAWMNSEYRCDFTVDNTLVTAGGKFALFAALQTLLREGDEVLIPTPCWVSYPQITRLFKGVPILMQAEESNHWKLTPQTLQEHITPRSKILILNNPGNPTGNLYSKAELSELLEIAWQANIFVIADEVYSQIVYDGKQFFSCAELSDQVLVIQSCSKNFAMTGWRIGFAFGPKELIRSMTALQGQSTSGPSLVSQWAALAALKNHSEITAHIRKTMQQRRDLFIDTFNELFNCRLEKPAAALYAFVPLSIFGTSAPSAELCTEWMAKHNIACVPGTAFAKEGYLRMAFTDQEDVLRQGLLALREAINP